jgi:Na+-driven multidrug efflux pump
VTYVGSVTIGISWVGILAAVCWGLNGGFNVIVMKCIAAGEFGLIRNYLRRQIMIVSLYSICTLFFLDIDRLCRVYRAFVLAAWVRL